MAETSNLAVDTTGGSAPAPAYDAETQAFIKQIDDYAADMAGKGYAVQRQAVVGPDGMDPYKALIAANTDPRNLVDVGYAFKTNKGNPAKVKNNPTGTIYANPNFQYRITNEAGKNKVLYTGTGMEGLQNVYAIAQELSKEGGKKANWGVEQLNPDTGQWMRVSDDDPAKNTLGKLAGFALPLLGAFAFPGLGILGGALGSAAGAAAGSAASGIINGKSIGDILKNAAITGGLSFAGGSLLGGSGGLGGNAASSAGSGAAGGAGAAGASAGSALGGAAGDIVVNGIRTGLSAAIPAAAGAAAGGALTSGALNSGSPSTPKTVDEILVEANKPLVNPSGVLDAATLASLGVPLNVSGGKPMSLSDVANYLKLASLGVGMVGNLFTGSGSGKQGTMPGALGTTSPIFSAQLPTTNTVFGSTPTGPRTVGPQDWRTYGMRPELSFFNHVPKRFAKGGFVEADNPGGSMRKDFVVRMSKGGLAEALSRLPSDRGEGSFAVRGGPGGLGRVEGPENRVDGPLGSEYTDPYGRRIYQSDTRGIPPVVMGREFSPPKGYFQQPDLYNDLTKQREYAVYMLNVAKQENSPNQVRYYSDLIKDIDAAYRAQAEDMSEGWDRPRSRTKGKTKGMAKGGYAVSGAGDGRSDSIPAELSDGEYVVDAETVALLGDGSSKAGAKQLDKLRVAVRKHKGKKLAKGEFSVKAKSADRYLKNGTG